MRRILFCVFLFLPSLAFGNPNNETTVLEKISNFMNKNVKDRTQHIETEGTIGSGDNQILVRFSADIVWKNFHQTKNGIKFEEHRSIKQQNQKLNAKGQTAGDVENLDRHVVRKYALSERLTTNSLVGITLLEDETDEDEVPTGFTTMVEISSDEKELYIYASQAGFSETTLGNDAIEPVSVASASTLSIDSNGNLITDETLKFYKVDVNKDFERKEFHRFNLRAYENKK